MVDEITTGWRETSGGVYKSLGIKPDLVVYGKAIGNGYAISAVVGKEKYMKLANKTFISSTAWTESTGFAAGIAVIDYFEKKKISKHLINIGKIVKKDGLNVRKRIKLK